MRLRRQVGGIAVAAVLIMCAMAAVPLTLNRLLDPSAGPAIRIMSFTPYALVPYAIGLVVAVAAAALASGTARRALVTSAVVMAVGMALHLGWLAPAYVGANPAPGEDAAPIVVLNANLYEGRANAGALAAVIRDEGVQIAVLQEITFGVLEDLEGEGTLDLLPYTVGEPNGAVDGTMILSAFPLSDVERLPTSFQSWSALVTVPDGAAITVIAAHPKAPVAPDGPFTWRADHAALLDAASKGSRRADLVLGDMNATPDHSVLRAWSDAGFRDSLELVNAGWTPTWPANGLSPAPGLHPPPLFHLDHVLVGVGFAVTGSRTVEIPGTDHLAVLATVAAR